MSDAFSTAYVIKLTQDINVLTMESIKANNQYEANHEKLEKQTSYEEKWESAFDSAQDTDKQCKIGNVTYKEKGVVLSDSDADAYAHAKVKQYDESLSAELAELDIEYDSIKTMYDSLLEEERAVKESAKQAASNAFQDTGLFQG